MYVSEVIHYPQTGCATWARLTGLSEDGQLATVFLAEGNPEDSECLCERARTAVVCMEPAEIQRRVDALENRLCKLKKHDQVPSVQVNCRTLVEFDS
jgi:hypothetical protein